MKKLSAFAIKFGGLVASLVLVLGVTSTQSVCLWWFHQPEVPKGMDKFKKR